MMKKILIIISVLLANNVKAQIMIDTTWKFEGPRLIKYTERTFTSTSASGRVVKYFDNNNIVVYSNDKIVAIMDSLKVIKVIDSAKTIKVLLALAKYQLDGSPY